MPVHSNFEAGLEEELQRPRRDLPGDAYPFRANRNRSEHDNVLSGKLEQMSLFSVLQAVSENRSSGNLIVHGADERGSIYVEDGQVVYVSIGRHKGAKAFYRLVARTAKLPAAKMIDAILGGLEEHADEEPFPSDISFVVLSRNG